MKNNMGNVDRIIRVLLAAILVFLYFNGTITGTLGVLVLIISGIFVVTSLINFCPLYSLFGISTCSTKK